MALQRNPILIFHRSQLGFRWIVLQASTRRGHLSNACPERLAGSARPAIVTPSFLPSLVPFLPSLLPFLPLSLPPLSPSLLRPLPLALLSFLPFSRYSEPSSLHSFILSLPFFFSPSPSAACLPSSFLSFSTLLSLLPFMVYLTLSSSSLLPLSSPSHDPSSPPFPSPPSFSQRFVAAIFKILSSASP